MTNFRQMLLRFGSAHFQVAAAASSLVLGVLLAGCGQSAISLADLEGTWRAVLTSPGGELPFVLAFESLSGELRATVVNGEERVSTSNVAVDGDRVTLGFEWYDSEITAQMAEAGRLVGRWRRTSAEGQNTVMDFAAGKHSASAEELPHRFGAPQEPSAQADALPEVSGDWHVTFRDEDGEEPARGEFQQQGELVRGTFLTPTGDYRYLEGSYQDGVLRLSTFDGSHAFLFQASPTADGDLEGDFWSRDSYHATWTATRIPASEEFLPDPWQEVQVVNPDGLFRFAFIDLDGESLSWDDPRFDGKVVVVNLFGSWCPNCNDEAPLLSAWYRRFHDQGLEIVGLAYEFTGNADRDTRQLRRFARRHDIAYPLLLAGVSDKKAASATVPDLSSIRSYPTTIFIGRDGKVRAIHSGFSGPGTGKHHSELVAEHEALIRDLLAEPEPAAAATQTDAAS